MVQSPLGGYQTGVFRRHRWCRAADYQLVAGGLFYKAFAGVMRYFSIELPANFTDFGLNLIERLLSGIRGKLTAERESIIEFGGSIQSWFSETVGINSPSRVFIGFGDNIVEDAAIGIRRATPKTRTATTDWQAALLQAGAGLALSGLPSLATRFRPLATEWAGPMGHGTTGQGEYRGAFESSHYTGWSVANPQFGGAAGVKSWCACTGTDAGACAATTAVPEAGIMFAVLGDIPFQLDTSFDALDGIFGNEFAEQARIATSRT